MQKMVVTVVIILSLSGLLAWQMYLNANRYYMVGADRIAYEIDRKTGRTWMLAGGSKEIHDEPKEVVSMALPREILNQITGNFTIENGSFRGDLYNGTDWVLTDLVITLSLIDEERIFEELSPEEQMRHDEMIEEVDAQNLSGSEAIGAILNVAKSFPGKLISEKVYRDIRWSREFAISKTVNPLSASSIFVVVADDEYPNDFEWSIVEARGYFPDL